MPFECSLILGLEEHFRSTPGPVDDATALFLEYQKVSPDVGHLPAVTPRGFFEAYLEECESAEDFAVLQSVSLLDDESDSLLDELKDGLLGTGRQWLASTAEDANDVRTLDEAITSFSEAAMGLGISEETYDISVELSKCEQLREQEQRDEAAQGDSSTAAELLSEPDHQDIDDILDSIR